MTKGFLILDQKMNTVILPYDDPDLVEFMRYKPDRKNILDRAHQHNTLKSLDQDIRAYLKDEYDG